MTPFFFGPQAQELFGAYDPPQGRDRNTGVVICYPCGQEFLRSHQSLRFLATLLARAGFHVLRFDYYGTGDSAGGNADGSIAQWLTDIDLAVAELKDTADIDRVQLVGLRMGAILAAHASQRRTDVERLVLWDPINGPRYAEALRHRAAPGRLGQSPEVDGFPFPEHLAGGLAALDINEIAAGLPNTLIVLTPQEDDDDPGVAGALQRAGVPFAIERYHQPVIWSANGELGTAGMPVQALRGLSRWLTDSG